MASESAGTAAQAVQRTEARVQPAASKSWGSASVVSMYEAGRPLYPSAAVDLLIESTSLNQFHPDIQQQIQPPTAESGAREPVTVVDVGAGTGKFTRLITQHKLLAAPLRGGSLRVFCVEPLEAMRKTLVAACPSPVVVFDSGSAENIPLADSSADVVVAAQAFHWFNYEVAAGEIHRVLKEHGKLCLVWNEWKDTVDYVRSISELMLPLWGDIPQYKTMKWKAAIDTTGRFTLESHRTVDYVHENQTHTATVDRVCSVSAIASKSVEQQRALRSKIEAILREDPETRDRELIEFPYDTHIYVFSAS